jgi:hypothetical protein
METHEPTSAAEAWKITCHEAGHAVVAVCLGIHFIFVENNGGVHDKVEVGVTPLDLTPNGKPSGGTQDLLLRWQQFYAGGAAAELLLFSKLREEYDHFAYGEDRRLHGEYERLRGKNRADAWDQDVRSAMKVLERASIQSLQEVARELGKEKKLDEDKVYDLLGRVRHVHLRIRQSRRVSRKKPPS